MTDSVLQLDKVQEGDRFYDRYGSAYEVASVGSRNGETEARMRVLDENGIPIGDASVAGVVVGARRNSPSRFYRLFDLQGAGGYADGTPGKNDSEALSYLPRGKGSYPKVALGEISYLNEKGESERVTLVAPTGMLTSKKRMQLGRELWAYTGLDPQRFEDVTDKERLTWADQRISSTTGFKFEQDDVSVAYDHDLGMGVRDAKLIKLVQLGD